MATDDLETQKQRVIAEDGGDTAVTADVPPRSRFRILSALVSSPSSTRYTRGSEIARGGLGRVTAALDKTLQRQVAIKELHERSEHNVRRFVRESLTTARLQHPAIVPVLDTGTWESGDPYLVMKLLEGKTLSEELKARTTTEARLALLPNLLAVADALGYAHAQGVVHRDVKPSNIMIGKHGETVLLDWGVAHDASATELETEGHGRGPEPAPSESEEPLTVVGTLAGTVRFMSPEQARGDPPTPEFDVYSLGVTMVAVLTGRMPFGELSNDVILEKLTTGESAAPELPPQISADLVAIVVKAVAAPGVRYADAGQLAGDLRKFIAGQLVSARRYTARQLLYRWIVRHRLLLAIAGIAAVAILVTAIVAVRSVVDQRNLAVDEGEAALARARDLILLQARSSLRTDPTETIAWLKQYPATAPHQDEVLMMVDEAASRGVARHVWHETGPAGSVTFAGDSRSVIIANQDGELIRADLDTGIEHRLAKLDTAPLYVRARGSTIVALDQDGAVYRWTGTRLEREAKIAFPTQPTGLYFTTEANALKVTYVEKDATYLPGSPQPVHGPYVSSDDEHDATGMYTMSKTGELSIVDPTQRKLWSFASHTFVWSSPNGTTYCAIEPTADRLVRVWIGTAAGAAPFQVAAMPACAPGEDQNAPCGVANDGSVMAIKLCGMFLVYDVAARKQIAIDDPGRVEDFDLSPEGRWIALARSGGTELVDLKTGATQQLSGGSRISKAEFSPDGKWLLTVGGGQGARVWQLSTASNANHIDDHVSPTRMYLSSRPGEVALRRHLDCSVWNTPERRVVASFAMAGGTRMLDDDDLLWAWDGSDDGHTCIFAGRDKSAVVVGDGGATRTLSAAQALESCVLAADGSTAFCRTDDNSLIAFDTGGKQASMRRVSGAIRSLVRYRGKPVVLVERSGHCALETFEGEPLAALPGGADCRTARSSNATRPGHESGIVIGRTNGVDVWSDAGMLAVSTDGDVVELSRELGLVAAATDTTVELWDIRTRARRLAPLGHRLSVTLMAWSDSGVLATADDETVRLWDPRTEQTRVLYIAHTVAILWAADGASLLTTDGRVVQEWRIDLAKGAHPVEVRARLDQLTSAQIVNGHAVTRSGR